MCRHSYIRKTNSFFGPHLHAILILKTYQQLIKLNYGIFWLFIPMTTSLDTYLDCCRIWLTVLLFIFMYISMLFLIAWNKGHNISLLLIPWFCCLSTWHVRYMCVFMVVDSIIQVRIVQTLLWGWIRYCGHQRSTAHSMIYTEEAAGHGFVHNYSMIHFYQS